MKQSDLRALKHPPTGTRDFIGEKYEQRSFMIDDFSKYMNMRGFDGVEISILEHLELYSNTVGITSDIVSKELFGVQSLSESDGAIATVLRAEGTLSVIRCLIDNGRIDEKDLRLYYCGPMFRYSRPQKGRFRQFTQLCCEIVNVEGFERDVEAIQLAYNWLSSHSIPFKLNINTLGRECGKYRETLFEYFKLNKENLSRENQIRLDKNVMRVLDQVSKEELQNMAGDLPDVYDFLNNEDREYFDNIMYLLKEMKIEFIRDKKLVRGLDYYRGIVFEFIDQGMAIGGGGRYIFDRSRFGDKAFPVPGVGWGLGLDRLDLKNIRLQKPDLHVIHVSNYNYANNLMQIINKLGERCLPVYGDFSNCFKIASKFNAKSIISFSYEDQKSNYVNYKTRNILQKVKIEDLHNCIKK